MEYLFTRDWNRCEYIWEAFSVIWIDCYELFWAREWLYEKDFLISSQCFWKFKSASLFQRNIRDLDEKSAKYLMAYQSSIYVDFYP